MSLQRLLTLMTAGIFLAAAICPAASAAERREVKKLRRTFHVVEFGAGASLESRISAEVTARIDACKSLAEFSTRNLSCSDASAQTWPQLSLPELSYARCGQNQAARW